MAHYKAVGWGFAPRVNMNSKRNTPYGQRKNVIPAKAGIQQRSNVGWSFAPRVNCHSREGGNPGTSDFHRQRITHAVKTPIFSPPILLAGFFSSVHTAPHPSRPMPPIYPTPSIVTPSEAEESIRMSFPRPSVIPTPLCHSRAPLSFPRRRESRDIIQTIVISTGALQRGAQRPNLLTHTVTLHKNKLLRPCRSFPTRLAPSTAGGLFRSSLNPHLGNRSPDKP